VLTLLAGTGLNPKQNRSTSLPGNEDSESVDPSGMESGLIPGNILIEEFEVVKKLGQGGMGSVYLVKHLAFKDEYYAVKSLRESDLGNAQKRSMFLKELRTWIDLPDYPHLTACRFFRTINDCLMIFAEYVDGGSLFDWIRGEKLTSVEQILDIAIQFARGLYAAHQNGVIHQDVKPANVLMTTDGIVKVTDFGLARAREVKGWSTSYSSASDKMVSSHGMTLAYCSREQAAGLKVNHRTDMWSWGLSVLEMFAKEKTWKFGFNAPEVFEEYLHAMNPLSQLKIPNDLAEILRRCLAEKPKDRWKDMKVIAGMIEDVYKGTIGRSYPRDFSKPIIRALRKKPKGITQKNGGNSPNDAMETLNKVLELAGESNDKLGDLVPDLSGTYKSQDVIDIELYEQARRIYSELIRDGRDDLFFDLATLLFHKAEIHGKSGDLPGALKLYNDAETMILKFPRAQQTHELNNLLEKVYGKKTFTYREQGRFDSAIKECEKSINHLKTWLKQGQDDEIVSHLTIRYQNKAILLTRTGASKQALELYDKTIELRKTLYGSDPDFCDPTLSNLYLNKGVLLWNTNRSERALDYYDLAIDIRKRRIKAEGQDHDEESLALIFTNKAMVLFETGNRDAAFDLLKRSCEIRERLVYQKHRSDLEFELAESYSIRASALVNNENIQESMEFFDKAIGIRKRLVSLEGRKEHTRDLAYSYMNKANAYKLLKKNKETVKYCDYAIEIWNFLDKQEQSSGYAEFLGWTKANKAVALIGLGMKTEGIGTAREAIPLLELSLGKVRDAMYREILSELKELLI